MQHSRRLSLSMQSNNCLPLKSVFEKWLQTNDVEGCLQHTPNEVQSEKSELL